MKHYLCASGHHFSSPTPRCPAPGCTAEVRPTAMAPSTDGGKPSFKHLPRLNPEEAAATPTTPVTGGKHAIRWWAYVDGKRVRRRSDMRDGAYRWDATCGPCGWDSNTGGDTMAAVDQQVQEHKR